MSIERKECPMSTHLMLHSGGREVSRSELALVPTPEPTATWFPVGHARFVDTVSSTLANCGFSISRERYALARDDGRLFGTLDLDVPILSDVSLAVGIRNSLDKSFPLGFCAGSRVFVCDNLAFRSELLVRRKHTKFGGDRFAEEINRSVQTLK